MEFFWSSSHVPVDYFRFLPEGCISEIFSLTSPKDAARFSAVSRTFMSAAESNVVWEKFFPSDYNDIISRSDSLMVSPSKKQLYLSLCDSPILLDGGKLSFSLDKKTGKKCFMVAATELGITWGDTPEYWEWLSHPDSRFSKVAKLNSVCWLDVRGKIETRMLSERTKYFAYLVLKLEDRFHGLGNANAVVRFVDSESDNDAEQRASVVRLSGQGPRATLPLSRDDGWMEVELGNFFNDIGEDGAVDARLMEIRDLGWKGGLIVQGVEFRPE
ncbi:putative F-box protein PP2-B12 [Lycium ferocissimum]|uniref:putative F-box protein PP2-B12 n=1 Tax=Lycium ferocissimum TaxID=112874 RepID=UPI002814B18D|nr:putative F-box protein PP2-B12 [Lycium ferocissimum]